MPRYPSDRSIRRRAEIAYHRAQALARNADYQADLADLRDKGYQFSDDGFEIPEPYSVFVNEDKKGQTLYLGRRAQEIRNRARLTRLVLPHRLRTLTVEEIERYDEGPLFVDVPGWTMARVARRQPGARRVPNLVIEGWDWYVQQRIHFRGLRIRHRLELYEEVWKVFDFWQELKNTKGRERRVIDTVWPGEWRPRPFGGDMASIHSRLYNYLKYARTLIPAAYLPGPSPTCTRKP